MCWRFLNWRVKTYIVTIIRHKFRQLGNTSQLLTGNCQNDTFPQSDCKLFGFIFEKFTCLFGREKYKTAGQKSLQDSSHGKLLYTKVDGYCYALFFCSSYTPTEPDLILTSRGTIKLLHNKTYTLYTHIYTPESSYPPHWVLTWVAGRQDLLGPSAKIQNARY